MKIVILITVIKLFLSPIGELFANHATSNNLVNSVDNYSRNNSYVNVSDTIRLVPGNPEYENYMNQEHLKSTINAQRAWIYSALVPGLGQIHNNQYLRAAIIWGVLLGLGAGAYYCHNQYVKYYHEYNPGIQLASFVKGYKKVRDSLLFVCLLCYIANIFDAYVGAELTKFDISDDVSVQIVPSIHNSAYNDTSLGFILGFSIN